MDEVTKYTKLWDLPQGYGNNWDHPYWKDIGDTIISELIDLGLEPGQESTLLDIGGGDGSFQQVLDNHNLGALHYTSLDIAPNSGADIIADISEYGGWVESPASNVIWAVYDFVIAIDMLEHLPTYRVFSALANIRRLTRGGAIFLISTRPDRGGKKIGATLHMTVRPPEWWKIELSAHWSVTNVLRVVKNEYCIIGVC